MKFLPGFVPFTKHPIPRNLLMSLVAGMLCSCQSQLIAPQSGEFSEVLVPAIEGRLLLDGQPQAGRSVVVARNEGLKGVCERPLATVESDDDGRFVLPAIEKSGFPDIQSSIENDWQVCVKVSDEEFKQIWFDRHSGVMWDRESTKISCELKKLDSKRYRGCKEQT